MNEYFPKYCMTDLDFKRLEGNRGQIRDFQPIQFSGGVGEGELPFVDVNKKELGLRHTACMEVIRKWNSACRTRNENFRYSIFTQEEYDKLIDYSPPDKPSESNVELW